MNLVELTKQELDAVQDLKDSFLIVESQVYGQLSDFRYHLICNKQIADEFQKRNIGRAIKDTGRTCGFWQNLGGNGIYRVDLIHLEGYPENLIKILSKCSETKLTYVGKTWKDILNLCPFNIEFKTALGVFEKPVSRKRKTAKQSK